MLTSSPSQRKTQQFGAVENRAKQKTRNNTDRKGSGLYTRGLATNQFLCYTAG